MHRHLVGRLMSVVAVIAQSTLVFVSSKSNISSCSLTRQASGDQYLLVLVAARFLTDFTDTGTTSIVVPGPCQAVGATAKTDFHPGERVALFASNS